MKNTRTRSGNIFESIKKEEEKEEKARKTVVETDVNEQEQVKTATKTPDLVAETTKQEPLPETPADSAEIPDSAKTVSDNSGNNYLKEAEKQVDEPVNNGLLYITPTRKKTRSHRKGFLLSDLALENLQKEARKYEISENELINQILEKML